MKFICILPTMEYWANFSTIVGTALSLIGIIITIWFGILTYRLTKKYGESEQKVKDLGLIIEELKIQNKAIIENTKKIEEQISLVEKHRIATIKTTSPRIKDVEMGIIKFPNKETATTHKYSVRVKNFGLRTAYNVKMKLFILNKINNPKINDTYGTLNTNDEITYQHHIEPQETKDIDVFATLPKEGFSFFKKAYIFVRFEYNDLMLGEKLRTEFYWKFDVKDPLADHLLETRPLSESEKKEVDDFIKEKKV
jgi:hypothetical protein